MQLGVSVEGTEDFEAALKDLDDKLQLTILKKAMTAGAELVAEVARNSCPVETGTLRDSIQVKARQSTKKGSATAEVQVGKGWYKGQTFYGAFVEFGHLAGSRRLGSLRKHVPPHPFLRPAALENKERVAAIAAQILSEELAAWEKKLAKKTAKLSRQYDAGH